MIKNIIWDFDGVIINSEDVRQKGFQKSLKPYGDNMSIKRLLDYHRVNGGLSRYHKIKYFFSEILKREISDSIYQEILKVYNELMLEELKNKSLLIEDSMKFILEKYLNYNFHIASGSDEIELNKICEDLNIKHYFISIHGSPKHKNKLVQNILLNYKYNKEETVLIGDSINDFEAAKNNGIEFIGYNNLLLKEIASKYYLDTFKSFDSILNQIYSN